MKASKKTTPADPEKKGKHVITINGTKYELTPEESARYNRLREREWSSYKKEYGNSKEAELDFGSSFLGGKGSEFITSGEYKKPMKESKSEYTNRAFGEYKKAIGTSENPDSLKQKDAMRAWIKDWVANNPEKEYSLGGLVKSMMPLSMKAKMEGGGKIPPQKKPVYGPPKPPGYKEPSREELKERKDEAAYLKKRKEADRAYESVIKDGGTKEQATKAAEKILSRGSYKNGGKFPPKIKAMLKKSKAPKKGGMLDETTVTAKAPTKTEKLAAKEFSEGLTSMKLGFPVTTAEQYYNLESVGNKAVDKTIDAWGDVSGAFDSVDKLKKDTRKRAKRGQAFRYKYGGKMKKYLKGRQIKLDANKDGKISKADFMMLRKK